MRIANRWNPAKRDLSLPDKGQIVQLGLAIEDSATSYLWTCQNRKIFVPGRFTLLLWRKGGLRACPSLNNNMTAVSTYLNPDGNTTGIVGYDSGGSDSTHWGETTTMSESPWGTRDVFFILLCVVGWSWGCNLNFFVWDKVKYRCTNFDWLLEATIFILCPYISVPTK